MRMSEPRHSQTLASSRARILPTAVFMAFAASLGGAAQSAEVDYQLELVLLRSDNLNLSETNEIDETVVIPRLTFAVKEEGSALSLEARGALERRHYLDNQFADETRSEFSGQLNWAVLPERLHLVLEDYLSEETITFSQGRAPGNLQQVNVLLGGPSFFARLGNATRFQLDLRAADSDAEVTRRFDGKRYSAAAALQRDLTPTSRASINLISTKAEFDDPASTIDYSRHDGFLRYEGRRPHVEYEIDLGHARLDRNAGDDLSMTIARATVQWQPSSKSRLRLRGRYQFADEVQDLIVRLRDPSEALTPELADTAAVTPGVYRERFFDVDYRFTGDRVGIRLRPMSRRLRFVDNPGSDRNERGVVVRLDYRVRPRMKVFATGFGRDRDFQTLPREDADRVYAAGVDYQLTRHWSWRAEAIRNTRDSNLQGQSYDENAVQFTVFWKR